jgi:hypothetical protein
MASVSSPAVSSNWRNSMASTITSTGTFMQYSNQSIRLVAMFTTSVSAFSTSLSNNWWKHTGPVFPSSSSLASSLRSSNGSQISHDSGLPQLLPSNNKLTCFSAYMLLMIAVRKRKKCGGIPPQLPRVHRAPRSLHPRSKISPKNSSHAVRVSPPPITHK